MTREDTEVARLVSLQLGLQEVRQQDRFVEDLGVESADLMNLIVTVEDRYGVEIEEECVSKLSTVADLVALVRGFE